MLQHDFALNTVSHGTLGRANFAERHQPAPLGHSAGITLMLSIANARNRPSSVNRAMDALRGDQYVKMPSPNKALGPQRSSVRSEAPQDQDRVQIELTAQGAVSALAIEGECYCAPRTGDRHATT